jgi:PPK2 family polyphosphate:nucleotide phosphotransferase
MKHHRVTPGSRILLSRINPDDTSEWSGKKKDAGEELAGLHRKLDDLQEVLYAEHKHRVLIVLQAMDTAGKDGTIRRVFEGVNPQGVRVEAFKRPGEEELAHDYLWRVHAKSPRKGEIVIFNRSHYEDVLVVRVHNLVPDRVIAKRYAQINDFERMLAEEGTTILKFYFHISKEEQKKRLEERLAEKSKNWKFDPNDVNERKLWPAYMKAYEKVLSTTSTEWAPWYVIPANKKWYRNIMVARILVETLEGLHMRYPRATEDFSAIKID